MDARYLPADLESRVGLWRDQMAGQRVLLVLDNAASSAQVLPLLPGSESCLVLVTSRRHLGDLPAAVPLLLEVLPPEQAEAMFVHLAPRATASPEDAVAELVRLAGHLPLAVSLLARVYNRHPLWTLADLAAETKATMLTLAAENDSVAAAFSVSWRHLDPRLQRFFSLLGMHPGATIDAFACAALAGCPLSEATQLLDALHGEGLLTETGYRRYGMHDLIRRYAQDRAAADPMVHTDSALDRLLNYYQYTAAIAEARLARQTRPGSDRFLVTPPEVIPDLGDSTLALAWARTERANLLVCLDHVTWAGRHARVTALTAAMASVLLHDGPWADAIARHTVGAEAARHLGDRLSQASALNQRGVVQRLTGDYPGAAQALEEALVIYRDLGDRLGQANTLNNQGLVRWRTDDYPGAAQALEEALVIYRDLDNQLGQANAHNDLGTVRWRTGDYPGAAQALEEALVIYRDLGHRFGEAHTLNDLGTVRWLTDDYPGAAAALGEALGIYRDLGDRLDQASVLNQLGVVRLRTGDYQGAAQAQEAALGNCCELGDRLGQAHALNDLGAVRWRSGDYPGAAAALGEALGIYRDLGDRLGEANTLSNYGAVRLRTGDNPGAAQALGQALAMYRDLGDRGGEVEALNEAGALHRILGNLARAEAVHRQALDLARTIGSPWDEAHALAGLGRCALTAGHPRLAQARLREALAIFQRAGVAEATRISAELDILTQKDPGKPSE